MYERFNKCQFCVFVDHTPAIRDGCADDYACLVLRHIGAPATQRTLANIPGGGVSWVADYEIPFTDPDSWCALGWQDPQRVAEERSTAFWDMSHAD